MTRVTTFQAQQSALLNLQRAQSREAVAGEQVTTGRKGDDLKAFGGDAAGVKALRTVQARVEGWRAAADAAAARLETQDLMLNRALESAGDARQAITEALANDSGDLLMATLEAAFAKGADALNAEHDGQPLFAGARTDATPFAARTLSDLTAVADPATLFANDSVKSATRVGERTVVQTGELASEIGGGLVEAFRSVQAYVEANGPLGKPLTEGQKTFLTGAIGDFRSAQDGLTQVVARNGAIQGRVDDVAVGLSDRALSIEGLLGDRTNIDPAEAVSRLQQAGIAVQASAQVFATLRNTSLLDLLR